MERGNAQSRQQIRAHGNRVAWIFIASSGTHGWPLSLPFCRLVRAMTVARCRGAAPMPAFSPATLFSPRAEKYLNIEIYICFVCHTFVRKYYYVYTYNAVDLHVTFVSYHTLFVQSSEPYVYVHVRVHVQRTNIFVEKVFSVASLSCTCTRTVRVHVHVRVVLYVIRKNPAKKRTFVTKNTYTRVRASTRARNQFL